MSNLFRSMLETAAEGFNFSKEPKMTYDEYQAVFTKIRQAANQKTRNEMTEDQMKESLLRMCRSEKLDPKDFGLEDYVKQLELEEDKRFEESLKVNAIFKDLDKKEKEKSVNLTDEDKKFLSNAIKGSVKEASASAKKIISEAFDLNPIKVNKEVNDIRDGIMESFRKADRDDVIERRNKLADIKTKVKIYKCCLCYAKASEVDLLITASDYPDGNAVCNFCIDVCHQVLHKDDPGDE